jgi:hypothetical protein
METRLCPCIRFATVMVLIEPYFDACIQPCISIQFSTRSG